jgi:hypothetical protein
MSASPSTIAESCGATRRRCMTETAATGSVGARIAPSTNPSAQPKPGTTSFTTTATTAIVAATSPTASTPIRRASARRSRGDELNPAP